MSFDKTCISEKRDVLYIAVKERCGMENNNMCREEKRGQGIGFERIRRITGYLVGTTDRWNDAKKAELKDRVKHM